MNTRLALFLALLLAAPASAPAAESLDETADSSVWLLQKSMLFHRDGRHNFLLRALRQLRDPKLQPLFADLVQKQHPVLKIHGILALGEVSDAHRLDLALLADIKEPITQAQLVTAALEADLLDTDQCRQLMDWPGLGNPVKVLIAGKLVADGKLTDKAALDKLRGEGDKLAMTGMLALLRLQVGDATAMKALEQIDGSTEPNRDEVRAMLLQTGVRHKFATIAPWAVKIAREAKPGSQAAVDDRGLYFMAIRAALLFKAPDAGKLWAERFDTAASAADRIRLSLLALDLAAELDAALFDKLLSDSDPLIQQMGHAGKAIASGQPADEPLIKLLEMNHALSSQWLLQYARRLPIEQGRSLLVAIILSAEAPPNAPSLRSQRIGNCVEATEALIEADPASADLLRQLVTESPELTQEAVIMGLIRASEVSSPQSIIEGIDLKGDTARAMALLLKAKNVPKLSDDELQALGLMVRGGSGLEETLRLQAAWVYLKHSGQDAVAMASVLGK